MNLQKFFSRKWLVIILVPILDVLIALGQIPSELKPLIISLITALGGIYVIVEGIIDALRNK